MIASKFSQKPADVTKLSILPWEFKISATADSTETESETSV